MNILRALKATKSILLTELDNVSAFAGTDNRDEQLYWLERLRNVNEALQLLDTLATHKVAILEGNQYEVMRTLVKFHHKNDDFGDNPDNWPYNRNACNSLAKCLDSQAKDNNY